LALVVLGTLLLMLAPAMPARGAEAEGWAWTARASGMAAWLHGVAHGSGLLVAVGDGGTVLTSPDGATWTDRTVSVGAARAGGDLLGVAYGGGRFVAVGTKGAVAASADGVRWSAGSAGVSVQLSDVAYGGGLFVAVGDEGTVLTSGDGKAWTARKSGTEVKLYGVTYGAGRFVAVGYGGTVLSSTDGSVWSSHSAGTTRFLSDVTYGAGNFLAVGEGDTVATSADGSAWSVGRVADDQDYGVWAVAFGDGQFVAAGGAGNILSSGDGARWVRNDTDRVFGFLDDLDYLDGQFVAVGNFGVIRTSGSKALKPEAPGAGDSGPDADVSGGIGTAAPVGSIGPADPVGGTGMDRTVATAPAPIGLAECRTGQVGGPRVTRRVGQGILIEADAAVTRGGAAALLCGNITINRVLKLDGTLSIDGGAVTGKGMLYVETARPEYHGSIPLFSGSFKLDGDLAELLKQDGLDHLDLGGLRLKITKLKLIEGGVELGAALMLPQELGGKAVKLDGLQIIGGRVQVRGKVVLPDISVGGILKIQKVMVEYDQDANSFRGQGRIYVDKVFGVEGALGVRNGRLDRYGVGVAGLQIPIDESGFFVNRIYGELDGLTNLATLKLIASADVTGGPKVKNFALVEASDLTLTIDLAGEVAASGNLKVVKAVTLTASLTFSAREHYVEAVGKLNAFDLVTGDTRWRMSGLRVTGEGTGTVRIPDKVQVIGGKTLASTRYHVGPEGISAEVLIARLLKAGCSLTWDGDFSCTRSMRTLSGWSYQAPQLASVGPVAAAPGPGNTFVIPPGMEQALVALTWDTGDADFSLVAPDGRVITPTTVDANIAYEKRADRHEAFYALLNPQPGTWKHVVNLSGGQTYRVELMDVAAPASFALTAPAGDVAGGGLVTIRWTTDAAAGSKVSLYYATGADEMGAQLADGLDAAAGTYTWTPPAEMASGSYVIYGLLDDGVSAPVKAVAGGRVMVANPATPAVPRGVTARAAGGGLAVSWTPNTEADLGGYRIHLLDTGETVAVGRVGSYTLTGLKPGQTYRVAVSAYSTGGLRSAPSGPVSAFLTAAAPPRVSVQWPWPAAGVTNLRTATVSGEIEAGSAGTLYLGDRAVAGPLTGRFSAMVDLEPGANQVRLVAVKPAGDTTEQSTEVYFDGAPPELVVGGLQQSMSVRAAAILVSGRTEPGAALALNGRAVTVGPDGGFAVALSLRAGANAVELVARDEAGNERFFKGVITATTGAGAGGVAACGSAFGDVPAASPACRSVELLAALNVVRGYPDGTFQPNRQVTRAEFAKMLVVALGRAPAPGERVPFADVDGHWAATGGYLQTAVALKAIAGFPDGSFQPDKPVTRAQAVKIAAAAAGMAPGGAAPYADLRQDDWFAGWVAVASAQRLIGPGAGAPLWAGGAFRGDQPATRAEAATLLANLLTR
jgi:hypothetical protein